MAKNIYLPKQFKRNNKEGIKLEKFFKKVSFFISKSKKILIDLIPLIILGESILIIIGVINFSWQNVGITSIILLLFHSNEFKGIL